MKIFKVPYIKKYSRYIPADHCGGDYYADEHGHEVVTSYSAKQAKNAVVNLFKGQQVIVKKPIIIENLNE